MNIFTQWISNVFGSNFSEGASSRRRIIPGVVIVVALGGLAVTIGISAVSSLNQSTTVPEDITTPHNSDSVISIESAPVYVHIVGAVVSPGLYELADNARVIDAVMAAGGFLGEPADCSVNLARLVTDGEQIVVHSREQGCSASAGNSEGKISLNRGSESDFDSLPGIGPTLAERIVTWRESSGPFTSIEQLNEVSGIGDKLFAGIKDSLTL